MTLHENQLDNKRRINPGRWHIKADRHFMHARPRSFWPQKYTSTQIGAPSTISDFSFTYINTASATVVIMMLFLSRVLTSRQLVKLQVNNQILLSKKAKMINK